jgi:methyltransferase-like protein
MANRVSQAKDVIWRRVGDDVVFINEDEMSLHVLNKTAAFIWDMCDGTRNIDDITNNICERFEVSFKEAHEDVKSTIKALTKLGIII